MQTTSTAVYGAAGGQSVSYRAELAELLRVLVVGGMPAGLLVAGLGSRIAMGVLRLTSPDSVQGLESDDGFTIGQVTLGGTYQLATLGAVVGFIGAAAYIVAAPWLIGPSWFRRLTVGVTAGVVVGPMVIHDEGIDFDVLQPRWLAVTLFVVLPVIVGIVLTFTVDSAARPDSWAAQGNRRWVVPAIILVVVPLALLIIALVSLVVAALLPLRRWVLEPAQRSAVAAWVIRAGLLCIPLVGLFALIEDLSALY